MYQKIVATTFLFALTTELALAQSQPSANSVVQLKNPLKVTSVEGLLLAILNVVMILAVPVIVFYIIYAGFLYTTARGNAAQIEQATRALTYAAIGGVVILGAVAIAGIVKNIVTSF